MNRTLMAVLASFTLTGLLGVSVVQAQSQWQPQPDLLQAGPKPDESPFSLSGRDLQAIQYTRFDENEDVPTPVTPVMADSVDWSTSLSFKLRPSMPDFSRAGAYGMAMFGVPEVRVHSDAVLPGAVSTQAPDLESGFSYSAGVRVEHEQADISGTAYVSSSLLGLSYGRLGRVWYSGVDVNLEQFDSDVGTTPRADVLSLDFTTGRRLNFTGRSASDPLWLLSLQGNFDMQSLEDDEAELASDWFLNPSLFWQHPGFTFSAQMQLPVDTTSSDETHEPDYRLRAIFQKRF